MGSEDKSAYAASKFAVQAISDALRVELMPFGVSVSCLAVGKVETAVLDKIVEERKTMERDADPQVVELYRPLIEFFDREVKDLPGIAPVTAFWIFSVVSITSRMLASGGLASVYM